MAKKPTPTRNPSLFDLTGDLIELMEGVQHDDPQVQERTLDALELTVDDYHEKVQGYICVADRLEHMEQCAEAEAKLLEARAKALKKRAAAKKNARARLWSRVMESYDALGLQKVETELGTVSKVANPPALEIEHDRGLPDKFWKLIPASKSLDKAALKSHVLETGETFDGIRLVRNFRIQVYR